MDPLESRREPGTSDPAPAEASQMPAEKPAPTKPTDPEYVGEDGKKTLKQKRRKTNPGAMTKKTEGSKKLEVVDSDPEASSDATSSSDDSDDDESESEVQPKKSKRMGRAETGGRRSRKALNKKGRKRKEKAPSSGSESDDDVEADGAGTDDAAIDELKNDKPKSQNEQQEKQEAKSRQQQQQQQQQHQQLMQLLLQGQAACASNPALAVNPAGFVPSDLSIIQAALRSPFIHQLASAQLLQSGAGQPGPSETEPPKRGGNARNQRSRNTEGRRKGTNTEMEVEKVSVNGLEYKRVDQVWDSSIHNYKLKETTQSSAASKYEGFLFHVRRTFDWEGKYKTTYVDIKSKELRECIREVIGDIKGVSLVEETPKLDPNLLFL